MTTKKQMKNRHRTLASLVMQGIPPEKAAERMADREEFGSPSETTVLDNWYNREDWLYDCFEWDAAEDEVQNILMQQKLVRKELWKMYRKANNENVKIGALNKIDKLNQRLLGMLQDAGEVERQPEKVDVRVADMKQRMRDYYKAEIGLDVQDDGTD